jgi:hypothetical protein
LSVGPFGLRKIDVKRPILLLLAAILIAISTSCVPLAAGAAGYIYAKEGESN